MSPERADATTASSAGTKTNPGGQYCMSDGSTLDPGSNKKDNVNYVGAYTPT